MKDYKKYLSERSENDEERLEEYQAELNKVLAEERAQIKQLQKMEAEREEVMARRNALAAELAELTEIEKKHFKEYMDIKREWICASDEKVRQIRPCPGVV